MRSEWQKKTLGDVCLKITDGAHASPKSVIQGKPMASVKDLTRFGVDLSGARHIAIEDFDQLVRQGCRPEVGDVLIAKDGNTALDTVCSVREPLDAVLLSSVAILRPKPDEIDSEFLKFYLSSSHTIAYLKRNFISGAAIPRVVLKDFRKAEILLPPLAVQRGISSLLSAIDAKIELNQKVSKSLESMVQAIFKSWFVDFDPVRAQMAGRQPEGMDATAAVMFPDELVESEQGLIPKGWEVATLKQLTSKIGSGATPKGGREVYLDEGVALIRSQNVYDSSFVWAGLARISDEAASQLKGVEVLREDVLINITGASILRTCVVPQEVLPARVNQHVAIIRAKNGVSPRYLHLHLLQSRVKDYLLGMNTGGSREAVTKSHIESVPILNPGRDVLLRFQHTVEPLLSEIEHLASEARVLSDIRDTLLPKLLSGELKVKEV